MKAKNTKIRLTKEFDFEMAHALYGHDGKCANIHGHSYKLSITLLGVPINDNKSPKNGMVIDFSDLKEIVKSTLVDQWDHALMLNKNSPHKSMNVADYTRVMWKEYQPTCENMLLEVVAVLQGQLPKEIKLVSVFLRETATSYAEWRLEDNI